MPALDLIDDTYIRCAPETPAGMVAAPGFAAELWPGWDAAVTESRGPEGVRWRVSGSVSGTTEVWLEPYGERGTVAHVYVRVDPAEGTWSPRSARRRAERVRRRVKAVMWRLADRAESVAAGAPPTTTGAPRAVE